MRFQRELTAAVLIPAVLAILIVGPSWAFTLLAALACGAALWEFQTMLLGAGLVASRPAGLVLLVALLAAAHAASAPALVVVAGVTLFGLPTLVLLASPPGGVWLASAAGSVLATLYVGAGGASMVGLRAVGWRPVLLVLAVVWAGDSAAYYAGRRFGRRPLAPVVSPKKTWEGFWGQLGGGALAGALVSWISAVFASSPATPPALAAATGAGLGLLVSVAAVVGDLVESTFKRSCSVKDSGGLLPGHGGLLDRLDSLLYASPVTLLVLTVFPGAIPR